MDPFPIRCAPNGSYSSWMELAGGRTHTAIKSAVGSSIGREEKKAAGTKKIEYRNESANQDHVKI